MDHLSSNILMCAMLLLFYASGTVEGVAFDGACDSTNICTEDRTECSSSTDKCACTSAAYRNQNNDECVTKVVLDATCVNTEPATQCADSLAECRDESGFKCLCKVANYKSGSVCKVKVAIDVACDIADMATDQCSVANTACRDDGSGTNKCLCTTDYYKLGTTCVGRKAPGATCSTGECVTNALCSTTCTCNTGYTTTATSCESSDAAIIIAHMYVFIFGIVASLYFLV